MNQDIEGCIYIADLALKNETPYGRSRVFVVEEMGYCFGCVNIL